MMKTTLNTLRKTLFSTVASITILASAIPANAAQASATPAPALTPTVTSASTAFQMRMSGRGKPMILIPGLASSGTVWDSTVEHYAKHYRCYVLTLAGFAGVPAIDGPLLQQTEQQLIDLIAANHLEKPTIVGHSLGGFLTLKLASDYPDKVGKIVIVDALPAMGAVQMPSATGIQLEEMARGMRDNMLASDPATAHTRNQQMIASMVSKPEDVARVLGWGEQSDTKTVANAMYEMLSQDMRQDIRKIKSPTLVLGTWIAYRDFAPRSAIETTFSIQYAKLPNVRIALADKARHFIMVDDPQWMFQQMDAFLK